MNSRRVHTIPQDWDEARDIPFFRVTARLFSSAFCAGATVLLASYDDDCGTSTVAARRRAVAAPALTVGAVSDPDGADVLQAPPAE